MKKVMCLLAIVAILLMVGVAVAQEEPVVPYTEKAYRAIEKKYMNNPNIGFNFLNGRKALIIYEVGHRGEANFEIAMILGYVNHNGNFMALQVKEKNEAGEWIMTWSWKEEPQDETAPLPSADQKHKLAI